MRPRCLIVLLVLPFLAALGCSHTSAPRAATATPPVDNRFDAGNPVIVRIAGRTKTLTIASTPRGPVYSVAGPDGQTLLSQGTLDDLRRQYPDLYRHVRSAVVSTGDVASPPAEDEDSLDYLLIGSSR
ncbi:MAG: hypothetical protein JWN40_4636 [Phycisphaerales bacterium]|nr:hypothetical protein [Phycisphaerales bacterium]